VVEGGGGKRAIDLGKRAGSGSEDRKELLGLTTWPKGRREAGNLGEEKIGVKGMRRKKKAQRGEGYEAGTIKK